MTRGGGRSRLLPPQPSPRRHQAGAGAARESRPEGGFDSGLGGAILQRERHRRLRRAIRQNQPDRLTMNRRDHVAQGQIRHAAEDQAEGVGHDGAPDSAPQMRGHRLRRNC